MIFRNYSDISWFQYFMEHRLFTSSKARCEARECFSSHKLNHISNGWRKVVDWSMSLCYLEQMGAERNWKQCLSADTIAIAQHCQAFFLAWLILKPKWPINTQGCQLQRRLGSIVQNCNPSSWPGLITHEKKSSEALLLFPVCTHLLQFQSKNSLIGTQAKK